MKPKRVVKIIEELDSILEELDEAQAILDDYLKLLVSIFAIGHVIRSMNLPKNYNYFHPYELSFNRFMTLHCETNY